jgi:hypothetical protein
MENFLFYYFAVIALILGCTVCYFIYIVVENFSLLRGDDIRFKQTISLLELAKIEEGIDLLERVTVIADILEPPQNELFHAIADNFSQGVQYNWGLSP